MLLFREKIHIIVKGKSVTLSWFSLLNNLLNLCTELAMLAFYDFAFILLKRYIPRSSALSVSIMNKNVAVSIMNKKGNFP